MLGVDTTSADGRSFEVVAYEKEGRRSLTEPLPPRSETLRQAQGKLFGDRNVSAELTENSYCGKLNKLTNRLKLALHDVA